MSIRNTIVLGKDFIIGKYSKGGITINKELKNIGRNIMTSKIYNNEITIKKKLSENKLEWTMQQVTEQCILGKISKEQAHKLIDRQSEILKQKSRDLLRRKTNDKGN
jgi:hypothetical protein